MPHVSQVYRDGTFILILYSGRSADVKDRVYWDGGVAQIKIFLDEHGAACHKNWICRGLHLQNVVVHGLSSPQKTSETTTRDKSSLSFITND